MSWSAREQKLQFHFLTITPELALLGTIELRWRVIAPLIGFNIHSCKHQLIVAKLAFTFSVNAAPFHGDAQLPL